MTALVKTLVQARPVGKNRLSTNIPFPDNNPDVYSTSFQEDFQPFTSKKAEPFSLPTHVEVDHKDLRYFKDYLTEAMVSYQRHPLPQIHCTPHWNALRTNFKMQTDPGEDHFLTTQSQKFPHHPFQPLRTPIRQPLAAKKIQQLEKLQESTTRASFTLHRGSPVVKVKVKHLEEGFPTIKGDKRQHSFVSEYDKTFQGAWSRAAQSVDKHTSSVPMGDPVKIVERKTTHAASFSQPNACRPPVVKERLKLNLGHFSQDSWSSTSKETFCHHKLRDPVVLIKRNHNSSYLPKGDTDMSRNKERLSVTTNRVEFSELNQTHPVYGPGHDLITKSHVHFSPGHLSREYYTTTVQEHYSKQDGERARPVVQQLSNILSGPEHDLSHSTTKSDYVPVQICRQAPYQSQQRSNFKFPQAHLLFSTTHSEEFIPQPLTLQCPGPSLYTSHFAIQ
ncbi:uncharacterized protein si:dkey-13m1.5 [Dicentrarchus labrax]|nr:uncharacterized protein si:dkey-13m1.5 [Dicentrarchus labrax]